MFELNWTNGVTAAAAVAAVLALIGLVTSMRSAAASRRAPPLEDVTVDGWSATGKVDLSPTEELDADDEARKKRPRVFVFKAEDIRTVRSASGVDRHEIRWRYATQEEAERAMSTCNKPKGT